MGGGGAGLLLSFWLARGLVRFLPYDAANVSLSASPDLRVLSFTTGITLLTALFFGLVPALQGARVSPGATLKEEAGAIAGGHGHVRLRKAFVGLQVGLSSLLLIGAGLFVRTLRNLENVELGFHVENVVMLGVRPAAVYDEARKLVVFRSVIESLATVPGVRAVGASSTRLLTGGRWDSSSGFSLSCRWASRFRPPCWRSSACTAFWPLWSPTAPGKSGFAWLWEPSPATWSACYCARCCW